MIAMSFLLIASISTLICGQLYNDNIFHFHKRQSYNRNDSATPQPIRYAPTQASDPAEVVAEQQRLANVTTTGRATVHVSNVTACDDDYMLPGSCVNDQCPGNLACSDAEYVCCVEKGVTPNLPVKRRKPATETSTPEARSRNYPELPVFTSTFSPTSTQQQQGQQQQYYNDLLNNYKQQFERQQQQQQ